jgi:hypothetical protein
MQVDFIRNYASRMAEIFAIRAANARKRGEKEDYVKELEGRSILWGKVAVLPTDSDKWEDVSEYIVLMSTPKTTKMELRRQYKFLQEILSLNVGSNFHYDLNATSTWGGSHSVGVKVSTSK